MSTSVLVVDDHADMRFLTAENLRRRFGFQVTEAASFTEAVARLGEGRSFELVVSDYMMPGGSGLDLLEHVQLHPGWNGHFILFTSAAARLSKADKDRTIVIDKFHMHELVDAIEFLGLGRE